MKRPTLRGAWRIALGSAACLLLAARARCAPAPDSPKNPLFEQSKLPFQAPPFDKIHDADYAPAIEEGMKQQLAEINAIAESPEAPTFANTIEAMERSGQLLTRAAKIFFNLAQSNVNDAMQKIRADEAPKLAAHQDAIFLNTKLFNRVQALYEKRETLHLDSQAAYLLERYELNFVRAGAKLSEADKTTLRALNKEEATLSTQFADKLLADTNAGAIVVDDKAELEGLSDEDLAAAAEAAKLRKVPGKWVLALQNTTQQPQLASLANRALRARLLKSSEERCSHGGDNDTRAIAARLAQLRAQKAKLLGFPDYASYVLDDQMAKTPSNAFKLMTDMVPAAVAKAKGEAAAMQKLIDAAGGGLALAASDWEFYAEKVRKAEFDLDQSEVKPYFDLE